MVSLQLYSEDRMKEYEELDFKYKMLISNEINFVYELQNTYNNTIFYIIFKKINGLPNGKVMTREYFKKIEHEIVL